MDTPDIATPRHEQDNRKRTKRGRHSRGPLAIGAALCLYCVASASVWAADVRGGPFGDERLGSHATRTALAMPASSQQGVAFSGELLGGREDGASVTSGYGGLTLPLAKRFGLDIEGLSYRSDDDKFSGAGAHLYWRNPNIGLLGVTASTSTVDIAQTSYLPAMNGIDNKSYGIEAEAYLGPVALALQTGRIKSDLSVYDQKRYTAFDIHLAASKRWYWLAGSRRIASDTTNRVETVYTASVQGTPVSLYAGGTWNAFKGQYIGLEVVPWTGAKSHWVGFAELDRGQDGYHAGFLGIRYEFGPVNNAPMISLFDRVTGGF